MKLNQNFGGWKITQALPKIVSFKEFVKWKPENERYKLHNRIIVKMPQPIGDYQEVRELQEINYPILWGGHPACPVDMALVSPTRQELIGYFFICQSLTGFLAFELTRECIRLNLP
ncbi:hypothetical protein [Nostoc sp.]|uniref:hypothetical protein n=1 Tax=Nostoc sp. TaxID=1180 RepID=UPI002FF4A0E4